MKRARRVAIVVGWLLLALGIPTCSSTSNYDFEPQDSAHPI